MLARSTLLKLSAQYLVNSWSSRIYIKNVSVKEALLVVNYCEQILRNYSRISTNLVNDDQDVAISSLKEFKAKNYIGNKYTPAKLQELFNLSPDQTKEFLKKYPKLKTVSPETVVKNYNSCHNAGVTKEVLMQYPIILVTEDLNERVKLVEKMCEDVNSLAPLLTANLSVLKRVVSYSRMEQGSVPEGNRIIYMSKLLNLPPQEICEKMIQHCYVLRIPIDRLENILKLLLSYGVEPQNIINDCWALRYSPSIVEERLQRAIQADAAKIKTWMIRCTDKVFERCINRQIENRKILGSNASVEEYLSKRLECSLENAKYLTEKYPAIMKMNILKMKEILDFLYEEGFEPAHVCRVPRILIHSLETTKFRINQLKQLGYVPPSLAILCKSKRDFDKILKKYSKRKKNADLQEEKPQEPS